MKSGDFQPTNFASTQSGIQAALDYAGALGEVYIGPGTYSGITNLTMYAKCTLRGAGALVTQLVRSASATGTMLREKTAAEGNASGATGITVRDISLFGSGSAGDGINFGNQGGAAFNANAQLQDILVRDFTTGTAVILLANAIQCRNVWCVASSVGLDVSTGGGSNQFVGLWAEACTGTHVKVGCPWNVFHYVQIEQTGSAPSGPLIDLYSTTSDRNMFSGVYLYISANMTNLVIDRSGALNNSYYNVVVAPNGNTYTNTIYAEGVTAGTGAVDWIASYVDTSASGKMFWRDQSSAELTTITGARPSFPQATIGTLSVTGASTFSGTITQGTAGVGNSSTFGQGTTGTDSSALTVRSGNGAGAIAQLLLDQNGTSVAGFRYANGLTFIDHGGTITFRNGISGPTTAALTTAGNLSTTGSMTIGNLTSGKYPKISTSGLIIDGPTPLAGTKVYYVSDTSGGAVTRKLTFTDGILTAET